ncbi:hypothetical protein [Oceanicoccus sp. KOV_DT_Chl]|uniref:DUF4403 family protein n=1 Tax=Oceanicoccus sp. KOV_DT_Chl TaxID=1904639 RepID=UPI000C79E812|nr:hypothetical protein [Oceanicoccus sp. KOV_DT_Chl]
MQYNFLSTVELISGKIFFSFALLIAISPIASAEIITDQLIGRLIEEKLPAILYEHKNKPWELGLYSITVKKSGKSTFSSDTRQMNTSLPLAIAISSTVNQTFMGEKINIPCQSLFYTNGRFTITPLLKPTDIRVSVAIDIPIPAANLDCRGFQLPIRIPLEQLVDNNKVQWQQTMASEINTLLQENGL